MVWCNLTLSCAPLYALFVGFAALTALFNETESDRDLTELEVRLAKPTKPVMLDFYADWCVSCKEMKKFTFTDSAVSKALEGFELIQVDVTDSSAAKTLQFIWPTCNGIFCQRQQQ